MVDLSKAKRMDWVTLRDGRVLRIQDIDASRSPQFHILLAGMGYQYFDAVGRFDRGGSPFDIVKVEENK